MATILESAQKMLRGETSPPPIARLLAFVLRAIEPGRAVFEMEVDEGHHNPMGTLHGGIYCDLADAANRSAVRLSHYPTWGMESCRSPPRSSLAARAAS